MICPECKKPALDLTTKKGKWALVLDADSRFKHILINELARVVEFDEVLCLWRHAEPAKVSDDELNWHFQQLIKETKNFENLIVGGTDAFWLLTETKTEDSMGLWTKSKYVSAPIFCVPTPEMLTRLGLGEIRLAVQKLERQYGKYNPNRARPISAAEAFGGGADSNRIKGKKSNKTKKPKRRVGRGKQLDGNRKSRSHK